MLTKREHQDPKFFERFRDHLLDMPVVKKTVHIRFFARNEDEILAARTIQRLFIILGRYCNYSHYEIIFHVSKRFCSELQGKTLVYHKSLTTFEKSTTVDVYLWAISALTGGVIFKEFVHMTMRINKPPTQCTLHEIRQLKESIDEKASLESYAMYIDTPGEGSVCVVLRIPKEVGWMVGVALTPEFRQDHLITNVKVGVKEPWRGALDLLTYLVSFINTWRVCARVTILGCVSVCVATVCVCLFVTILAGICLDLQPTILMCFS